MRWLASTAFLAGIALFAGVASASATYPDVVKTHLALGSAPQCALCHSDGMTGIGTVHTLFGATAKADGLVSQNTSKLTSVLDKMKTDKVDSDGDGVGDIDELVAGTDPNVKGGGVTVVKPELTYGCAATVAPGRPAPSSGAALGLGLVAAAAWARRRRGDARRSRRPLIAAAAAASTLLFIGCYDVSYVTSDVCPGGLEWTGGDQGSPNMHPGVACIDCHTSNGGPRFSLAGTVFPSSEPDDCLGAKDASIVVTGADGKAITITANEAGNFYSELAVKVPYQAKIVSGGKTKIMFGAQTTGDCNSCHTVKGANGAPGRITLP
jgi:hypothetical protein